MTGFLVLLIYTLKLE